MILSHQLLFYLVFLGVEMEPCAILGHCNVRYSAICSSNCRVRGIFDISNIEAQQLQLAWHAAGVCAGGVATKRVSKPKPPPKNHPHARKHTQSHTHAHTHTCTHALTERACLAQIKTLTTCRGNQRIARGRF